jgi:hypothetical protein
MDTDKIINQLEIEWNCKFFKVSAYNGTGIE